jgi:hypothetical protein
MENNQTPLNNLPRMMDVTDAVKTAIIINTDIVLFTSIERVKKRVEKRPCGMVWLIGT